MGIFSELYEKIPPLKQYLTYMFEEKKMSPVKDKAHRIVHLERLKSELFNPVSETNKDTSDMTKKLGGIVATALLAELRDEISYC